jgi:nucleoside-diphosphate kinase
MSFAAARAHALQCRHGTDIVRNAVHVTDLEEDGPLEAEYLFKIL